MEERHDAFGQALLDRLDGRSTTEVIERDDGGVECGDTGFYYAPFRRWPPVERRALRFVRGRVLDVGCGAGRVALELERRGHEVVAIDVSPGAVEVCRRRGVGDVRLLPLARVGPALGRFDTVVMFGNNFGLVGSAGGAERALRRLAGRTTPGGRIVAGSSDPYATLDPAHLAYHVRNRTRGRMTGQVRMRVRYRLAATPWFDYLFASPDEMAALATAGGWRLARLVREDGHQYVGVLEKR